MHIGTETQKIPDSVGWVANETAIAAGIWRASVFKIRKEVQLRMIDDSMQNVGKENGVNKLQRSEIQHL
jgi:hypothetical protein